MDKIKMFEDRNIRTVWNEEEDEWYFSVVDVCWVLADSADFETARKYWNKGRVKCPFGKNASE